MKKTTIITLVVLFVGVIAIISATFTVHQTEQVLVLQFGEAKRVVTELVVLVDGKKTQTTRWSDFVEVGGIWWAQRWEHLDAKDRVTHRTRLTVEGLDAAAFTKALAAATAGHEGAIMLAFSSNLVHKYFNNS